MTSKNLERDKEIITDYKNGLTLTELGLKHNRSRQRIQQILLIYGISRRRRGRPSTTEHGTVASYTKGCRCEPCRVVNAKRRAVWEANKREHNPTWKEQRLAAMRISQKARRARLNGHLTNPSGDAIIEPLEAE